MKKIKLFVPLVLIFTLASCSLELPTGNNTDNTTNAIYTKVESSISEVANKVLPSCVGIIAKESGSSSYSIGSGVVISKEDSSTFRVITNAHVVLNDIDSASSRLCDTLMVCVSSQYYQYNASCLKYDKDLDLALLEVKVTSHLDDIAALNIYDNIPTVTQGETCIAIGCPISLTYFNTVTYGVVSKPSYKIDVSNNKTEYVIQHDAAINPGNSGGGLFNMNGDLIGINFEKKVSQTVNGQSVLVEGIGYAISITEVLDFLN